MDVQAHALSVQRTARYCTAGPSPREARAVWWAMHGYGQRAEDFIEDLAPVPEAGGCVVVPEALSRFYTEGTGGTVGASWMTSASREAEIEDYLAYLDALANHLPEAEAGGGAPACVLGFSQGAATAARWAAHRLAQGQSVRRLVLWAGGLPPDVAPGALAGTRLTLVVGTRDAYVTADRLAAQRARLDDAGTAYDLLRFDGGHRLDDDTLRQVVRR